MIWRCEAQALNTKTTYCQASYLEPPHAAIHPMKFIEDVIDELRCIAGPGCGCWKNSIWFDDLVCIAGATAADAAEVLCVNPLT